MIQELTDCGPSRTYPVYYLEDAMNNLGDCFDYAVNDYGAEGSEIAELFCLSGVAREFERGNAWVVSGKSGVESSHLSPKGRDIKAGLYRTAPIVLRRRRSIGRAGYWHICNGVWASLSKTCCMPFRSMRCAICITPGTKPQRSVWRVLFAI